MTDEIADYLERYATDYELPVKTGCGVKVLLEHEREFVLDLHDGTTVRSRVIGRSWQWTRSSALISGVSRDAEYLLPFIRDGLAGGP